MPIKALGDYIIVEPEKIEVVSSDCGIIIPTEEDGDVKNIGFVVSVGDSCKLDVFGGSKVYFNTQAGTEIEVDGLKLRAIHPQDVIAILTE
jgi:co-chaperonin GroES (HSP10)